MRAMHWAFKALDRLFFRDGRPMNQGETTWVESQFPPTGRTLQGAVRTAVIQFQGKDFDAFRNGSDPALKAALGDAGNLGNLKLTGPFLSRNNELLFPVPLDLVKTESGSYDLLCVKEHEPFECDLGRVVIPRAKGLSVKPQEGKYLTAAAIEDYLAGNLNTICLPKDRHDTAATLWPLLAGIPEDAALADREPKMGLERNDGTRTAEDGMLYSIAFVRPREGVALKLVVDGLEEGMHPQTDWLQPLGGEGKLAGLTVSDGSPLWPAQPELKVIIGVVRFKLVLTTPALFDIDGIRCGKQMSWLPDGFTEKFENGVTYWAGMFGNIECQVVSACIGKPQKIGGWDIANNRPRKLTCYVPAGSVYFCRAKADQLENIKQLRGDKIGLETEYGFGHVLVGTW